MKISPFAPWSGILLFFAAHVAPASAQPPVVPRKWLTADQLQQVETRLQKDLDTGVDMVGTAWGMAVIKDAELLIVYISLYEKLSEPQRSALLKEQEAWLERRQRAVSKGDDGKNGSVGRVMTASEFQDWTEKRTAELKDRLRKL
jgi:uncharacterized protein YecT (DUF1311 family)